MIKYTTGNIFEADAEALINTVNCEGFMGKGLAYQFKLKFPNINKAYVNMCKHGMLRPGNLQLCRENDKFIINFPTKDKWRAASRMEYVTDGLDALIKLLEDNNIKSVAIPPLGCGNGGLAWDEVKAVIESKLYIISDKIDIIVYEPFAGINKGQSTAPKLGLEAYLILLIKKGLVKGTKLKLQAAIELFSLMQEKFRYSFDDNADKKQQYSFHNLSKQIIKYEKYYKLSANATDEVLKLIYTQIISKNVEKNLAKLQPIVDVACNAVNSLSKKEDFNCLIMLCHMFNESKEVGGELIVEKMVEQTSQSGDMTAAINKATVDKVTQVLIDKAICYYDVFGKFVVRT